MKLTQVLGEGTLPLSKPARWESSKPTPDPPKPKPDEAEEFVRAVELYLHQAITNRDTIKEEYEEQTIDYQSGEPFSDRA